MAASEGFINVRLPRDLKDRGDRVLAKEGISVSEAIRQLYKTMDETQEVPECCKSDQKEDVFTRRRALMRSMVGIAPLASGEDASTLRAERLACHVG